MTRNGKIARLSRALRDELNRRLQDGEPGTKLVLWLNGLPEVQAALARQDALSQARELTADAGN